MEVQKEQQNFLFLPSHRRLLPVGRGRVRVGVKVPALPIGGRYRPDFNEDGSCI